MAIMNSWTGVIMMGLLMNISSVIPALFFKIDKKVKISIMIRLYLLSIFFDIYSYHIVY